MPWITVREEARRDLIDHYVYLAENASEAAIVRGRTGGPIFRCGLRLPKARRAPKDAVNVQWSAQTSQWLPRTEGSR